MTAIMAFRGEHGFLSNFHEHHFYVPGSDEWWPTAEHAFQAAKASDWDGYHRIVQADSPAEAKKIGRRIAMRPDWDQIKRKVMLRILLAKFDNGDMARQLQATGSSTLVEGNHWGDHYWGAVPAGHAIITTGGQPPVWSAEGVDPGKWMVGHNWLGQLLMWVREVA